MGQLWQDVMNILTAPFVGDLDLAQLFLLVGVVLLSILLWGLVLHYIRMAASAATEVV